MTDPKTIIITDKAHGLPFSKGLLAQSFMATGLAPSKAWSIAAVHRGRAARAQGDEDLLGEGSLDRRRAPAALGGGEVCGALPEAP